MKKFSFLFFVLIASAVSAQKFTIKGQLKDSVGVLPGATIMILQQKDSSLVQFGVSNSEGKFEVKNIVQGDYLFKISFTGYSSYTKRIYPRPENGLELDLGLIQMHPKTKQLNEVIVKGEKDPVKVKRDTIEYNAPSFKVKANANVEDLLKKLPGVEVDNSGTITAQGEQVQKVMVDGREFFGQDPKLATRNLPADAVDKVQVYDKKSDQTIFSGIDDGQRQKTVNLALKEEKRHAAFGNDLVGGGHDLTGAGGSGRFQASASINRFDKGNQLSFLGMGNDVNQQGFSFGDYANFNGASTGGGQFQQQNTGLQNGIVTNYAGGVNTNRAINNDNTKINANYFYNRMDQNLATTTHRINYLPNDTTKSNTYNFDQFSSQHSITDNHRGTLIIDHKIDSANSVKFTANVGYTASSLTLDSQGKTMRVGNTGLQNENQRNTTSNSTNTTLTSSLLLRHRFPKKGRTVSTNLTFNYTDNNTKGTLNSTTKTYGPDTTIYTNQRNGQSTMSPTYGVTLSYTEPLGGRKYLEANYNFTTDINKVDKEVYNSDNNTLNTQLTNKYNSNYLYNRPGLNFRINREKFNFSLGAAFQDTRLYGNLILKNQIIDREFQAILPAAHFNYDFSQFTRFRFDYTTNMQEPTVQQLQPIIDNSDPLNKTVGNPQLSPAYAHQIRSHFTFFNPANFMNVFAFITGNYTNNAITSLQATDSVLARTTKPINVHNSMSLNGNFNVGVPVKKLKSRFNIGPSYSASKSINVQQDYKNNIYENNVLQQTIGGRAGYNYSLGDILIVDLSMNLSHQESKYSFSTQQNQTYFNKTYSAEVNVNFLKNYSFNSETDYFIYTSTTTGFRQTIPLWKMSVSRFLLKNKTGELKLTVNNILNYGVSITQTATSNYLQQVTNNNLGRYFMISFTYALNRQLNPMNGMDRRRGGGGRMMMIRQ
ncbi:MAG: outer membrane beta-barrel protein [Bacteroidetes bacterium]|nr:outer membrane beta-barrel protein [Bacteroidota bacterium]